MGNETEKMQNQYIALTDSNELQITELTKIIGFIKNNLDKSNSQNCCTYYQKLLLNLCK